MASGLGGRRRKHVDPEPFMIRTSVGVREFKVCTLCACLVLAEQRGASSNANSNTSVTMP